MKRFQKKAAEAASLLLFAGSAAWHLICVVTNPVKPPIIPPVLHRGSSDPVLLFRYSALTFNGHRIHYDRDYVTKVEGYPGLIFHGPLQAALIVEFAAKLHGDSAPKKFSYRGVQPLFEGTEFSINANETHAGMELWIANADGQPTMKGMASW
jgi:3-methylfumaryl-CoA hydratase